MEPSYGFGSKLSSKTGTTPGPGQYDNKVQNYSKISGIMSREMKNSSVLSNAPGPGEYDLNLSNPKGKVTFSKDEKLKLSGVKTPGPGEYSLKPTFADVPKYLLPDKA